MNKFLKSLLAILFLISVFILCKPGIKESPLPILQFAKSFIVNSTLYSISGKITGLTGILVVLNNNSTELTLDSRTEYSFSNLTNGSSYDLTISKQPSGLICNISNAKGIIHSANITNVDITCSNGTTATTNPPTVTTTPTVTTPTSSNPPTVTISNLKDKSTIFTGFMVGTASDTLGVSKVEVSFDSGAYITASGTTSWKIQLPFGSATWKDGSKHTIKVRAQNVSGVYSTDTILTVFKDKNHDINGDGYSDLIVSATNSPPGYVYIYYSSGSAGITATSTSTANKVIAGENTGFGDYMILGDLNSDGYADLVASDEYYSTNFGRVYIFYSTGSSGITQTFASSANKTFTGTSTTYLGSALEIADINGDGYSDLITSDYSNSNKGRVYIFHSSASGITAANLAAANTTITGAVASQQIGYYLSTGDYNGDGFLDLTFSSIAYPATNKGSIYIFNSTGASGITATLSSSANTTINGVTNGDSFGYTISSGDINGDGYGDIVVGANQYQGAGQQGMGYIFLSSGASGVTAGSVGAANTTYTGESTTQRFGDFVWLLDVNADGYKDVIIGAGRYPAVTTNEDGRIYIFHASSSGVPSVAVTSANKILTGIHISSTARFGAGISGSDINGDGYGDLITSANLYGATNSDGVVYIFHSSGISGITNSGPASANSIISAILNSNGRFGFQVY